MVYIEEKDRPAESKKITAKTLKKRFFLELLKANSLEEKNKVYQKMIKLVILEKAFAKAKLEKIESLNLGLG
jgi:hypothetical protein